MNKLIMPDYDSSILSVVSSVLHHYGVKDCDHPTQPEVDKALSKNPDNIVIMLFDGMGLSLLEKHLPEDSFLRSHMKGTVSSVFPPTTVAATTTIQSGLSPLEHGWLGWTLYFKEVNDNVKVFSNRIDSTGKPASSENLARTLMPYRDVCDRIMEVNLDVKAESVAMHMHSHTYSVGSSCRKVLHITRQPGKHYIYCYWINPDHLIHKYGVNSRQVHNNILKINRETEKMSRKLQNTTVVILADHSLIDTKWVYLEDTPELYDMLLREPSIESRAASLFVKDGKQKEFAELFNKTYGDSFVLLTKEEVLADHLFGTGTENGRVRGFLGDYLAIAVKDVSLGCHRGKHEMIGMHAGLTATELTVPLIIIEK